MSCRGASTASATTACSPVPHARPILRVPASCLASRRRREPVELPEPLDRLPPCPCCGGRMIIIETFERWRQPRAPPHAPASTGSTPVVTRHGLRSPHAATPPLRRMPPGTPFTKISANVPVISRGQIPISRRAWGKISLIKLSPVPVPSRFRRHHNQAKLEIPIDRRRSPAGSCLGGFRTPAPCPDARPAMAGIRKPSPYQSLSGPTSTAGSGRQAPVGSCGSGR